MNKSVLLSVFLGILVFLQACGQQTQPTDADENINIVTTIGQITDITKIVGGTHVEVTGLMGPGVDPHLYVASEGDVSLLQNADIIFYNGLFLEAQMEDVLEQIGTRKTVIPVAGNISPDRLLASPIYEDEFDPHIWFDVTLWMQAVETVKNTLVTFDPDHTEEYEKNAENYLRELEALDKYVAEQALRVPENQRILITAHDAFNYFGKAYQFEVKGLQGISTAAEAGTGDVQNLADFIVENQIQAIFIETSVPVRSVEALQAAVASKGWQVKIGGELFSDAMGNPDTPEGTYIGMVRHNIDTIVTALLGDS